jgi:hypothetical protein
MCDCCHVCSGGMCPIGILTLIPKVPPVKQCPDVCGQDAPPVAPVEPPKPPEIKATHYKEWTKGTIPEPEVPGAGNIDETGA